MRRLVTASSLAVLLVCATSILAAFASATAAVAPAAAQWLPGGDVVVQAYAIDERQASGVFAACVFSHLAPEGKRHADGSLSSAGHLCLLNGFADERLTLKAHRAGSTLNADWNGTPENVRLLVPWGSTLHVRIVILQARGADQLPEGEILLHGDGLAPWTDSGVGRFWYVLGGVQALLVVGAIAAVAVSARARTIAGCFLPALLLAIPLAAKEVPAAFGWSLVVTALLIGGHLAMRWRELESSSKAS